MYGSHRSIRHMKREKEEKKPESSVAKIVFTVLGLAGVVGILWYLGRKSQEKGIEKNVAPKPEVKKKKTEEAEVQTEEQVLQDEEEYVEEQTNETSLESVVPLDPKTIPDYMYGEPRRGNPRSDSEAITKGIVEEMFGKQFYTVRPLFLRISKEFTRTGNREVCVELDLFNRELMLAIEYNGIQHYLYPNFCDESEETFLYRRAYDKFKEIACRKYNVYLITVPYKVPHHKIKEFIYERLPPDLKAIAKV